MNAVHETGQTIVLPRTYPDLDGVACAVAHAEFMSLQGIAATAWLPTEGDSEAEFVLSQCSPRVLADASQFDGRTQFVLVDASDLEGLPSNVDPLQVVDVIDHRFHGSPNELFPNARIVIEAVGAAATIVVENFRAGRLNPSPASVTLLYGAIHSNTQRLRGSITTERDRTAAKWLEELGADPSALDEQFTARREHILSTLDESVMRESKSYDDSGAPYVIAQLEFEGAHGTASASQARLVASVGRLGARAMLNMVDVATGTSALLVPDEQLRSLVATRMGAIAQGILFEFKPAILRKQIVAALRDHNANR